MTAVEKLLDLPARALERKFFDRDTLLVAPDLLGKILVHQLPSGRVLAGTVVETEAYTHDDPAFHAWGLVDPPTGLVKPTGRGYDLFGPPGQSYVYLCYGVHWLLNVVTEREGNAGCVLIRALEPIAGIDLMYNRRHAARRDQDLTNGPGKLTSAMRIDKRHHKIDLTSGDLFFAEDLDRPGPVEVATSARIGISRAIDRPWRFYIPDCAYVSKGIPSDIAAKNRRKGRRNG